MVLLRETEILHPLLGWDVGWVYGERGGEIGGRKVEGMGKDGNSPGREMREVEGVEEQQGGKGRGRTAELNLCCRAVPCFWPSGPAKGHRRMETATMVMESPNTLAQDTKWS